MTEHRWLAFDFDERKTLEAAARLAEREGGRINYMKLIKLLYLADRKSFQLRGRPISGDTYYSLRNGPILSRALNLAKEAITGRWWPSHFGRHSRYSIELTAPAEPSSLSRRELKMLDEIYAEHGNKTQFELADWMHENCGEWREPPTKDGRLPISAEEILAAVGVDADEIARLAVDMENRRRIVESLPLVE